MATSDCPDVEAEQIVIKKYLTDNIEDLSEVYSAHKQGLETSEEEVELWEKFIKDYNVLETKLTGFPDKTSYETMVPIGSLAYMKGQQIHTNEILVPLGDNWFTERSAKDAVAIISRRKQVCQENLKSAKHRCKIHRNWLKQTEEMASKEGNLVEIEEEVTEEEYQQSIERHNEMVARHFEAVRQEKEGGEDPAQLSTLEDEAQEFEGLLRRLDELEEEERLKDELAEKGEEVESEEDSADERETSKPESDSDQPEATGECGAKGKDKLRRRVSWADQITDTSHEDEDETPETAKIKYRSRQKSLPTELIQKTEELADGAAGEVPSQKANEVTNSESSGEVQTPDPSKILEANANKNVAASPHSPSDIYKMFDDLATKSPEPHPKGILKKKGESFNEGSSDSEKEKGVGWNDDTETIEYIPKSPEEHPMPLKTPLSESPREIKKLKPAFSYKVVARGEGGVEEKTELSDKQEPKKISRFKLARMNK